MTKCPAESRSGTREWSAVSVNCVRGCEHRCRYCYARAEALRFVRIASPEEWGTTYLEVNEAQVRRKFPKYEGTVMFPTTHDITPRFLQPCLDVLGHLLEAGNQVLVVSKPAPSCIDAIIQRFRGVRELIEFRFTIGCLRCNVLEYWEPGAPSLSARIASLRMAYDAGFETSLSAEPLLDASDFPRLLDALGRYATTTIWVGGMNQIAQRVVPGTDPAEIARIKAGQTPEAVRRLYELMEGYPKIRWKEPFRKILGLPAYPRYE
jgi:DNA repair photolyase